MPANLNSEMQETVIENTRPQSSSKKLSRKQIAMVVALTILILITVVVGKLLSDKRKLEQKVANLSNAQNSVEEENKKLDSDVRHIYEIDGKEEPTILNIVDATEVRKSQAFFERAQNGDKALIYTQQKVAILYRPSTKKIVNAVPFNPDNQPQSTTPGTSQQPATNKTTR